MTTTDNVFIWLSGIMTFSTGIFLTIVRLYEPLFRYLFLTKIYQFWGEIYMGEDQAADLQEKRIDNDALSTFLSSSLNVELVFIILESITTFAATDGRISKSQNIQT